MNFRILKTRPFIYCLSLALFNYANAALYADLVYVGCFTDGFVSVIDTDTNTQTGTITVGRQPLAMALTPDKNFLYVINSQDTTVSVIDTFSNTVVGSPITVGSSPAGIAFTPDGAYAYVINQNVPSISVIQTSDNTVIDTIDVSSFGLNSSIYSIVISSAGLAYVPTFGFSASGHVGIVNTSNNTIVTSVAGPTNAWLKLSAITPNQQFVYITDITFGAVRPFQTSNNTFLSAITVGDSPNGIAVTPNGNFVYATNSSDATAYVIQTSNNTVTGTVTGLGTFPSGIAITGNGRYAYVANETSNDVSIIDLSTNTVSGSTIGVGQRPISVVIKSIIIPTLIEPASSLTGSQKTNNFGLEYELYNVLEWQASPSLNLAGYYVYRDNEKIATLKAWNLSYEDHGRKKGISTTYSVSAFDDTGDESTLITVTIF